MQLNSSPKIFENYKCDYPENTIKKIEESIKKLGLQFSYTEKKIVTGNYSNYYGELLLEELGFLTCGKGITSSLAKASAYAEMAERISSGFFVFHTITDNIIEYNQILEGIIERKFLKGYQKCDDSNQMPLKEINKYLENPLSKPEYKLLKNQALFDVLVDGYSFTEDKNVKIPIRLVEVVSGSTGLAAGNTFEEALVQGSCEILERYVAYQILSNKIECKTIKKESIKNQQIQDYIKMFDLMNIETIIKDFSLNRNLPVIAILFTNKNIEKEGNSLKKNLYYKMIDVGSHPDLTIAILRCFTERLQGVTKEEFMYRKKCDILFNYWVNILGKNYMKKDEISKDFFIDYEDCGDISFLENGQEINFNELKTVTNTDFLDDCKYIIKICKDNKWDLQVIDYTHKTLKFPALRVIIPPISTSHDPYALQTLKIEDIEQKFNFLYDVKNLYKYVTQNDWIKDKKHVEKLVENLEEFLSRNLSYYRFLIRQNHFLYPVNLFNVLAFSNFYIGNYKEALNYFDLLLELSDEPPFYSTYFNILLNPGYDPVLFYGYKQQIKRGLKENKHLSYTFLSNPFEPKNYLKNSQIFFKSILIRFNDSFFVELKDYS